MTQAEYKTWMSKHFLIFGVTFEGDVAMFDSWYEVLGNYDPGELASATDALASSIEPPKFLREHLSHILRHVRSVRSVRYKREDAEHPELGTCTKCSGSGFAIVPHLDALTPDGAWEPGGSACGSHYYTMAVICSCDLGKWTQNHTTKNDKVNEKRMTIEQYSLNNSHWPAQMNMRRAEARTEARLTNPPDPGWDSLVKRILERCRAS
jgi:hypothetical protein